MIKEKNKIHEDEVVKGYKEMYVVFQWIFFFNKKLTARIFMTVQGGGEYLTVTGRGRGRPSSVGGAVQD